MASRGARIRWRRWVEQVNTLGLSVLLGLIVWLIAINQENPIVQRAYQDRLPVAVRGLAEGLLSVQDLSRETVEVVLQAPQTSWDNLEPGDFSIYIDLTGLDAGVHEVDVEVDVVDPRVRVISIQRPGLRVQLDRVVSKEVPARVDLVGTTAFGYDWQAPVIEPLSVTVTGPETQVAQVAVARAEVNLGNAKSQVERNQQVTLQNAEGQAVTRVNAEPSLVHVIVPVEQWPGRKEVAVRVNLTGQPAAGYRLSTVRVNPSTMVLLGDADILAQVPGFVETDPVDLTNATAEIQVRVPVRLPDEVTVLEGTTVDVTASIAAIEGGTTVRQQPVIQGVGPGLEATIALETVDVILSGPLPFLEALGPDDVFVIVDLTGLLAGNHVVTPRVVVPTGIRAQGVLPETVEVVITAAPTPEAAATATVPAAQTSPLTTPVAGRMPITETVTATVPPPVTPAPPLSATRPVSRTQPVMTAQPVMTTQPVTTTQPVATPAP